MAGRRYIFNLAVFIFAIGALDANPSSGANLAVVKTRLPSGLLVRIDDPAISTRPDCEKPGDPVTVVKPEFYDRDRKRAPEFIIDEKLFPPAPCPLENRNRPAENEPNPNEGSGHEKHDSIIAQVKPEFYDRVGNRVAGSFFDNKTFPPALHLFKSPNKPVEIPNTQEDFLGLFKNRGEPLEIKGSLAEPEANGVERYGGNGSCGAYQAGRHSPRKPFCHHLLRSRPSHRRYVHGGAQKSRSRAYS